MMDPLDKCSNNNTCSLGSGIFCDDVVGKSKRLKPSALLISEPFLYTILYWYVAKVKAHLWILAKTSLGIGLDSFKRPCRGL